MTPEIQSPTGAEKAETVETEAEARARRSIHVVGAVIILITMVGVIWGVTGGRAWAKKRQFESIQLGVRADLDLVYRAQTKFYSKHGFYTTDLNALELWPKRVLYAFGFVKPAQFPEASAEGKFDPAMRTIIKLAEKRAQDAIMKAKTERGYKPDAPIVLSPITNIRGMDFDRLASFCPDCTATKSGFKMVAAANLDDDSVLDVWTIDQTGKIEQLIDDLK